MSAKAMLCTMIAGSVAVMLIVARRPDPRPAPTPVRAHERPWLSSEAAQQIIGPDGSLGPLFSDAELGRSAPAPEVRARIAEFARANDVEIHLEVVAGDLVAVRFAVTYGGCCGYEGADALGRQLGRARAYNNGCCSDSRLDWADDWAKTIDGVHIRGHIHVNRVEVRWERAVNLAELLDNTEGALGKTRASVRESAGDRWTEVMQDEYLLEVPYPFDPNSYAVSPKLLARDDLGVRVETDRGRVGQVSFVLRSVEDEDELLKTLRARWGRPRTVSNEPRTWTWRNRDREITAMLDSAGARVVIRDPNSGVAPDPGY